MDLFITLSTFACVTLGVLGAYWAMSGQPTATAERLRHLGRTGSNAKSIVDENPVAILAERVAEPIHRLSPPSVAEAHKLQKQLMQAGYRSPNAPIIYRATQLVLLVAFPFAIALGWLSLGRPISSALIPVLIAFVVGFALPRFILKRMISSRQLRIRWGLADALDLMVISIEAGLGLNAAMVRVSEELRSVHPDVSKEFELVNLEMRVGREREEALRNLGERTGVDDLQSFCAMLIQADRFGTSIARAVRVYADSLRTKRRQRAEQAAQKAAVKLLLPLTCFLFPAYLLVILGPAVINLLDQFINT